MKVSVKNLALVSATKQDPRWVVVVARDASEDGKFYYAVKTTGVYRKPSCAGRPARPENVQFHPTGEEAKRTGFRPRNRCKPHRASLPELHIAKVVEACRLIEDSEELPNLEQLAIFAGLSVFHFHRVFKSVTGLTPKAYAMAHPAKRERDRLDHSGTVTAAIFNAGYNSNSRFYEKSNQLLGMTPTSYPSGGANTEIRFAIGECSLEPILAAASVKGVCAILLGDDPDALARDLQDRFPNSSLIGVDAAFEQLVAKVLGFVEAPAIGVDLPLDIRGTSLQQAVWQALREIPAGLTASYNEVPSGIGSPTAVRAVAGACTANVLAVAIPCHRVVRNHSGLGYRWVVERKCALLKREANG